MQLQNLFLKEFTKQLIINSLSEEDKLKLKQPTQPAPEQKEFTLNKIKEILQDRNIMSIECTGPGRFILIDKPGGKTSIQVTLDQEEIEEIINFFSHKTRIPRVGGIFKAILNNLTITAIDSEFGGPRFIITKILPQQSRYL